MTNENTITTPTPPSTATTTQDQVGLRRSGQAAGPSQDTNTSTISTQSTVPIDSLRDGTDQAQQPQPETTTAAETSSAAPGSTTPSSTSSQAAPAKKTLRNYDIRFKREVLTALDAARAEAKRNKTSTNPLVRQISAQFKITPNMIYQWDRAKARNTIFQAPAGAKKVRSRIRPAPVTTSPQTPSLASVQAVSMIEHISSTPHIKVLPPKSRKWDEAHESMAVALERTFGTQTLTLHDGPEHALQFTALINTVLPPILGINDVPFHHAPRRKQKPRLLIPERLQDIADEQRKLRIVIRREGINSRQGERARRKIQKLERLVGRLKKNEKALNLQEETRQAQTRFMRNEWKYTSQLFDPQPASLQFTGDPQIRDRHWLGTIKQSSDSPDTHSCSDVLTTVPTNMPQEPSPRELQALYFSEESLRKTLMSKRKDSTPGHDGIAYKIYARIPCLYKPLMEITNSALHPDSILPSSWFAASIKFTYKKGSTSDPTNFRPLGLTPTIAKLVTGRLADYAEDHMTRHGLWSEGQKGFLKGVSGCLEHQELVRHVLGCIKGTVTGAGARPKELVMIQTDLANAYGTVKHSLIQFALQRYRFPPWFQQKVKQIYSQLFWLLPGDTTPHKQEIGILQGDPLSPILFNITINLVLEGLDDVSFVKYGVNILTPQPTLEEPRPAPIKTNHVDFADDIVLMAGSVKGGQALLDRFKELLDWTGCFKGKAEKFGAIHFKLTSPPDASKRTNKQITSHDPKYKFNGVPIPFLGASNKPFRLLGAFFPTSPGLQPQSIEELMLTKLTEVLDRIDKDKINDSLKIRAVQLGFPAFFRWHLQVNEVRPAWIKQDFQGALVKYVKKWSSMGPNVTTAAIFLSWKDLGLGIKDPVLLHREASLQKYDILKHSRSTITKTINASPPSLYKAGTKGDVWEVNKIHAQLTTSLNLESSEASVVHQRQQMVKSLGQEHAVEMKQQRNGLEKQGHMGRTMETDAEVLWLAKYHQLPPTIVKFGTKALLDVCMTAVNRATWFPLSRASQACPRCGADYQTLSHILCECDIRLKIDAHSPQNRITFRHNRILRSIYKDMEKFQSDTYPLSFYGDLEGLHHLPSHFLSTSTELKPDLIVVTPNKIIIGELTSCMEHNFAVNNARKTTKYQQLRSNIASKNPQMEVILRPFEVGARGGVASTLEAFLKDAKISRKNVRFVKENASRAAIKASEIIFNQRNSTSWCPTTPQ